jgi:hypothetical protein
LLSLLIASRFYCELAISDFELASKFGLRDSDMNHCTIFTAGGFQVPSMIDGGVSFGQ